MIPPSHRPGSTPSRSCGTNRPSRPPRSTGRALACADVTVAAGSAPNDIIAAAVDVLAGWTGRPPLRVDADHEVYLTDPAVLTGIVTMLDR